MATAQYMSILNGTFSRIIKDVDTMLIQRIRVDTMNKKRFDTMNKKSQSKTKESLEFSRGF